MPDLTPSPAAIEAALKNYRLALTALVKAEPSFTRDASAYVAGIDAADEGLAALREKAANYDILRASPITQEVLAEEGVYKADERRQLLIAQRDAAEQRVAELEGAFTKLTEHEAVEAAADYAACRQRDDPYALVRTIEATLRRRRDLIANDVGSGKPLVDAYQRQLHELRERVAELERENERLRRAEYARYEEYRKLALAEVERRGFKDGELQSLWRHTVRPYDSSEVVAAICDALTREGMTAWNGDGTSCVEQMIRFQYDRAAASERARAALQEAIDQALSADGVVADDAPLPIDMEAPASAWVDGYQAGQESVKGPLGDALDAIEARAALGAPQGEGTT